MDHQVLQPSEEEEEGAFKIIAVSAVIITIGITILAIIVYSVLGPEQSTAGPLVHHDTDRKPPVYRDVRPPVKNPLCQGRKACLQEAQANLFEDFPKGKMSPDTTPCSDMFGHVCTDKYTKASTNEQPMRYQSLHFIITKIMSFINASVDKDIGYPQDSALVQTMLFVKNCTSSEDRLKVNKKSIYENVMRNLELQGFPFVDEVTNQALDVVTAGFTKMYVYPFFRTGLTHRGDKKSKDEVYVRLSGEVIKFKIKTKSAKTDNVRLMFLELKKKFTTYIPQLENLTDTILEECFDFITNLRVSSLNQSLDENVTPVKDLIGTDGWSWVVFLNSVYKDIQTFTKSSEIIVKNRPFFDAFILLVKENNKQKRAALNYLGFYAIIYLMPFYPDWLAKDQTLIGAKVHSPATMPKRPQICMRRTEYTCPYGVPSLLAQVFANSTDLTDVTKNFTWWIDPLKATMKRFVENVSWLGQEDVKLVNEKITNMTISLIFPNSFTEGKKSTRDLKCDYNPKLFQADPMTHFVDAIFSGANVSKLELKTKIARPMLPVTSNFEFTASYNPKENSLFVPMGLFGQILQATREETKIFYVFKILPDVIREMVRVFMKSSFLSTDKTSWTTDTAARYSSVEKCMFDFYRDYLSDVEFEVAQRSMVGILEPLLCEVAMIQPLREMYDVITKKVAMTDPGLWERGFGRYRELHLFYFFLIESQCESSARPPQMTKEILIQQGVPGRLRLMKSISTIKEFSDAFNCELFDDMDRAHLFQCYIYQDKKPQEA